MALMLRSGAVFLHVPKTGGSWVTRVLEEQGLVARRFEHIHAGAWQVARFLHPARALRDVVRVRVASMMPLEWKQRIRRSLRLGGRGGSVPAAPSPLAVPKAPGKPFVFCFVRHPLRWYESYWKYQMKMGWIEYGTPGDPFDWHPWAILRGIRSDDFNTFVAELLEREPGYVSRMYGWYVDGFVDFVGRQERLAEDLVEALRRAGERFDVEAIRGAPRVNVSLAPLQWDPVLRREALRLEYAALRRFGYHDTETWETP